jgi:hypothetical protein
MEDRFTFFPFWSVKEKSGAVSPTAKLRAVDTLDEATLVGAKAAAEPTRRADAMAKDFMLLLLDVFLRQKER